MKRGILISILVLLITSISNGQSITISSIYEKNLDSNGKSVNKINDMNYVYDKFEDVYQIFPTREYYENQENSDLGYKRFVLMGGQIGGGTLIGDIRVYMLIMEFEDDGTFLKNNEGGRINILTDEDRIPVKYVSVKNNESSLLSITGMDEEKWKLITNSENPRLRINNTILNIDSLSISLMKKLSNTVDEIRINMFNIKLTFSDGNSYPKEFNREIIQTRELNVIPIEEGVVDFDIKLNEDGTVNYVRWDPVVGGVEPDISNLEEVKKNLKEGWVFGSDTTSNVDNSMIELEMRIKKRE